MPAATGTSEALATAADGGPARTRARPRTRGRMPPPCAAVHRPRCTRSPGFARPPTRGCSAFAVSRRPRSGRRRSRRQSSARPEPRPGASPRRLATRNASRARTSRARSVRRSTCRRPVAPARRSCLAGCRPCSAPWRAGRGYRRTRRPRGTRGPHRTARRSRTTCLRTTHRRGSSAGSCPAHSRSEAARCRRPEPRGRSRSREAVP